MRVLVLHQHYWPEIAATAQILSDVCEDVAALGHEVTVLCGQPSYRPTEGAGSLLRQESHGGVHIERLWSYPSRQGIPRRLLHYGTYFSSSLLASLTRAKPDVCLVLSTPPLLLGISGALLNALRGVPFVYSVQDLYPDIAVHLGVIRAGGMIERVSDYVANACYQEARAIVTLSPGMADRLIGKGVDPTRVHVIPNWADTSAIVPSSRDNPFSRGHGLSGQFVVQYSGNLGMSQGLECVIGAAEQVRDLPVTLLLVGDGNARSMLASQVGSRGLTNVRFLPPQPRDMLSDLLASCDVSLVPMRRGVGEDLVPSKLYGIMAASRPILASVERTSEVARVVTEHDCGWVSEPESPEAMAQGIRRAFLASSEERAIAGANGRRACTEYFSRRVLTTRYAEVLSAAAGAPRARSARTENGRPNQTSIQR